MNFLDLPSVGCPSLGLGAYPCTACIAKLRNAHTTPNHGGPGGCWQWTASRHNPCNQGLADFLSLYSSVLLSSVKHDGGGEGGEASFFVFVTAVVCGGLCCGYREGISTRVSHYITFVSCSEYISMGITMERRCVHSIAIVAQVSDASKWVTTNSYDPFG